MYVHGIESRENPKGDEQRCARMSVLVIEQQGVAPGLEKQRCARMFVFAIEQQGMAQKLVLSAKKSSCGTADGRRKVIRKIKFHSQ